MQIWHWNNLSKIGTNYWDVEKKPKEQVRKELSSSTFCTEHSICTNKKVMRIWGLDLNQPDTFHYLNQSADVLAQPNSSL